MYVVNKFIGYLANPTSLACIAVVLALVLRIFGYRKLAQGLVFLCFVWVCVCATPLMSRVIGISLENDFLVDGRVPLIESYTNCEAIVLHGGSMGDDTEIGGHGEMWTSADRVWMAVRLWKAGKAPVIYAIGSGVKRTTAGLLADFGVPTNAVVFAGEPRNTEEEAKFIARALPSARVLVVTSAWHMRRTMLMYAKYAPEIRAVPAPCDFENTLRLSGNFAWSELLPSDEALVANRVSLHEWIGLWGYQLFR